MKLEMKKFGELLISRPAGREALLVASAYLLSPPPKKEEAIELDFDGVKVLAPSWLDEFLTGLKEKFQNRVRVLPSNNPSVTESLKAVSSPPIPK